MSCYSLKVVSKIELYACVVTVAKPAAINLESNCSSVSPSSSELREQMIPKEQIQVFG